MRDIDLETVTERVQAAYGATPDPRLRHILTVLIARLHDFVREVDLTPAEWEAAMAFLARAAETTTPRRNEFILLSDLLGVSALVDLLDGKDDEGATITTLLGPFYVPDQPDRGPTPDLIGDNEGDRVVVRGRVTGNDGKPVAGARIEVWQNAPNGLYSVQDPDQPEENLRCTLRAGDDGAYSFSTVKPCSYEIPDDGAGGDLVRASNRHCWRPAHIHLMISADGYKRQVSQIFNKADPYIDEDSVFGVRAPLAVDFDAMPTDEDIARFPHVAQPFNVVEMDFTLAKAG